MNNWETGNKIKKPVWEIVVIHLILFKRIDVKERQREGFVSFCNIALIIF